MSRLGREPVTPGLRRIKIPEPFHEKLGIQTRGVVPRKGLGERGKLVTVAEGDRGESGFKRLGEIIRVPRGGHHRHRVDLESQARQRQVFEFVRLEILMLPLQLLRIVGFHGQLGGREIVQIMVKEGHVYRGLTVDRNNEPNLILAVIS